MIKSGDRIWDGGKHKAGLCLMIDRHNGSGRWRILYKRDGVKGDLLMSPMDECIPEGCLMVSYEGRLS